MQNYFSTPSHLKSSIMRLFLCKARRQIRSIVCLCEEFGDRRLVQKEPIRTIFLFEFFHRLIHFTLCVVCLQILTLVVGFATTGKTDCHLCKTFFVEE